MVKFRRCGLHYLTSGRHPHNLFRIVCCSTDKFNKVLDFITFKFQGLKLNLCCVRYNVMIGYLGLVLLRLG